MAIVGIDLGTTNSACGIWKDGKVQLIPNRLGEFLTPSVVGFDDSGKISVGKVAKERLISHSDKTVAAFKRLMGTSHKIGLGRKEFTATELSSLVLRSLKEDAEHFLGEPVTEAVISVPAYFNDNQRHATKVAGELAGLKVGRLINEPTAAAISFGLHERPEGLFVILDLGGGTFDVSILEFFDGVMQVHASAGDNFLGGEDFVDAMSADVLANAGIERKSLSQQQAHSLYMQMESAKRRIESAGDIPLKLELGKKTVDWVANEEWFNKVATPLLLRIKRPIETALRDSAIALDSIDEIILVGGATRMKIFRTAVARLFGRFPAINIDPDLAIAMGAAVQGGLLMKDGALDDVVLTDVAPYTLGIEVNGPEGRGGHFMPIIERNSVVPVSVVRPVFTASNNQTLICANIYQGEHRLVEKNVFLGSLNGNVPRGPAGQEQIDVRYSYDMNGLLEVELTVCSTGAVFSKVIEQTPGAFTDEEKKHSLERLAGIKFHPREQEENRALLARGERMYETSLAERRDQIASILAEFDKVLNGQRPVEIQKARIRVAELLDRLDTEEWI